MTLQSHLAELERRHHALEVELEKEMVHPGSDDLRLCALKKQKLRLKDEIERLRPQERRDSVH